MHAPLAGRLTGRRLAVGLLVALLVLAAAMVVRYALIEPRDMGLACVETVRPWWCGPRDLLVFFSLEEAWGLVALAAGLVGVAVRLPGRALAWLALAAGLVGLVLYNAGTAAAGLLLAIIGLLRR